ncbi:CAAX prenyl protease 2-like [Teleopsis dalmanni]|uniref:CAAX prenyl protease 2-like n=1 Tax=Teleopsis dalmanni TaxID=139649 RepID=UPI0018CCAA86|nr:CAAX prenyl protease 2-like [Teleopsis dalmanni]XP_037939935.1 CAAX prenyl protease 2-like [Teleopsis dalmanni]
MNLKLRNKQTNMTSTVGQTHISPWTSVSCCFGLSLIYVASLYVWNNKHNRDHPTTVKKRFCSVFVVMLIAPVFVYAFSSNELLEEVNFLQILGIRLAGLWQAIVVPFLLTLLLFLGPICVQMQNETLRIFIDLNYWKSNVSNLIWWRNHVVAPLSEEFVYRGCMMPLILQSFTPMQAVFITPLFFGTAHVHHIGERLGLGMELKTAILISVFQLTYTTVFGFYSAYLFARTGHIVAPFLVHAFCNHMGVPDLQDLWQQHVFKRVILIIIYLVGFFGWCILLPIATAPEFYSNCLYWPPTRK